MFVDRRALDRGVTGSTWRDSAGGKQFGDWEQCIPSLQSVDAQGLFGWRILRGDWADDPDFEIYDRRSPPWSEPTSHAAGRPKKKRGRSEIRRDRAARTDGLSNKRFIWPVEGLGCPCGSLLTAGQKGDAPQADACWNGLTARGRPCRQAYDADHLRPGHRCQRAARPSSPTTFPVRSKYPLDNISMAKRHLVECASQNSNNSAASATRFEKDRPEITCRRHSRSHHLMDCGYVYQHHRGYEGLRIG